MRPGCAFSFRHSAGPLLAAVALSTAGCSGLSLPTLLPGGGDDVEVAEIRHYGQCATGGEAAAVALLADEATLRDWQSARGIDLIAAPPGGLLPPGPFAVVEHGTRSSAGYGLVVSRRAYQEGRELRLTASFLSPKAGAAPAEAPTSPCVLVKLPPGNYDRLSVVDPAGKRRAQFLPPVPAAPATAP